MEQLIISALSQLDCSPKEIKLFLASYTLGPAKIGDIAKKARVQRSTAYLLSEQLIAKNYLSMTHQPMASISSPLHQIHSFVYSKPGNDALAALV